MHLITIMCQSIMCTTTSPCHIYRILLSKNTRTNLDSFFFQIEVFPLKDGASTSISQEMYFTHQFIMHVKYVLVKTITLRVYIVWRGKTFKNQCRYLHGKLNFSTYHDRYPTRCVRSLLASQLHRRVYTFLGSFRRQGTKCWNSIHTRKHLHLTIPLRLLKSYIKKYLKVVIFQRPKQGFLNSFNSRGF